MKIKRFITLKDTYHAIFYYKEDKREKTLEQHKKLTLEEPGCVVFDVTQDIANPYKFNVYEEFIDQTAFEYHQQRMKASEWGRVAKNVKGHYQVSMLS